MRSRGHSPTNNFKFHFIMNYQSKCERVFTNTFKPKVKHFDISLEENVLQTKPYITLILLKSFNYLEKLVNF